MSLAFHNSLMKSLNYLYSEKLERKTPEKTAVTFRFSRSVGIIACKTKSIRVYLVLSRSEVSFTNCREAVTSRTDSVTVARAPFLSFDEITLVAAQVTVRE